MNVSTPVPWRVQEVDFKSNSEALFRRRGKYFSYLFLRCNLSNLFISMTRNAVYLKPFGSPYSADRSDMDGLVLLRLIDYWKILRIHLKPEI